MKRYDAAIRIFNAACTEELAPDAVLPSRSLPCTLNMWSNTVSFIDYNECRWDLGSLQGQGKACPVRPSLIGRLGWHSWWWTAQHAWLNSLVLVDRLTTTQPNLDIKMTCNNNNSNLTITVPGENCCLQGILGFEKKTRWSSLEAILKFMNSQIECTNGCHIQQLTKLKNIKGLCQKKTVTSRVHWWSILDLQQWKKVFK